LFFQLEQYFSHNKSTNSVFQPTYQHSRTGPISISADKKKKFGLGNSEKAKKTRNLFSSKQLQQKKFIYKIKKLN
jgi:hypothetical protein